MKDDRDKVKPVLAKEIVGDDISSIGNEFSFKEVSEIEVNVHVTEEDDGRNNSEDNV